MKCEYCGGNISIEDERCPFCDAPNPFYEAHREDMNKYKKDYENTKQAVEQKNRRFRGKTVLITVIAVLFSLCLITSIIRANMWEINYDRKVRFHKKHAAEYAVQMQQLQDNRDYLGMAAIYENCYFYAQGGPLEKYTGVGLAAEKYSYLVKNIGNYIDDRSFYTAEDLSKNIATKMNDLYSTRDDYEKRILTNNNYTEEQLEVIDDMIDQACALLNVYLGIDEDVLADFPNMGATKRQLVIEEAIIGGAEDE